MNCIQRNNLVFTIVLVSSSLLQAAPFVTTFVNTADVHLHVELHFSDNSVDSKGLSLSQSYQVVNFANKMITSAIFSSADKDKNGNFYGQLHQKFPTPKSNVTYNISLQDVPAHTVQAAPGTQAFEMPDTKEFVCKSAPVKKLK